MKGASHILVDFPGSTANAGEPSRRRSLGPSSAYLIPYTSEELINWSNDENGQYDWVVLRRKQRRQPDVNVPDIVEETYWYYFDKQNYRIYRREQLGNEGQIRLVSEGLHGLAKINRVPLFTMRVSDGLWLDEQGCADSA